MKFTFSAECVRCWTHQRLVIISHESTTGPQLIFNAPRTSGTHSNALEDSDIWLSVSRNRVDKYKCVIRSHSTTIILTGVNHRRPARLTATKIKVNHKMFVIALSNSMKLKFLSHLCRPFDFLRCSFYFNILQSGEDR